MKSLQNKVALVTGGSKGIGKALVLKLASQGANIVFNYAKDEAAANQTVKEIEQLGTNALAIKADSSNIKEIERLFSEAKENFGKIDIVIANAGFELIQIAFTDYTEEQFDKVFNISGSYCVQLMFCFQEGFQCNCCIFC